MFFSPEFWVRNDDERNKRLSMTMTCTHTHTQNEIDWAASDYSYHYNDVEPIHSGLMQNPPLNVETSHHSSSSVTVSIFGALSEILSHTTESLSFLTSTTTEHTPLSHTHSTFLSTSDNKHNHPIQIQKIHSDQPKTPSMTGDSTTNTNVASNEFQLPILNAFDSSESITSSKPSATTNEQVDEHLMTSSLSQISTQTKSIAFSSTAASILKSNPSASVNDMAATAVAVAVDDDANASLTDQMHHHPGNHGNISSNSGGIMIVLATSDRSSMQSNRTPHAIQHTEQPPLKMQINTISEMPFDHFTMAQIDDTMKNVPPSSTHRSLTNETVIPIYPVYDITTNSPITHIPSSVPIDNQSLSTEPTTIDHSPNTASMPFTTTTTSTTSTTPTTTTATVTTTTTTADLNLTETPIEHSVNSVNISLFDLESSYPIVNNDVNLTRLNHMMAILFNQPPPEWQPTMTNTELTVTDLSTINVENNNNDPTMTTTHDIETATEMVAAISDEPQTMLDMTEVHPVETTTAISPSDGLSSTPDEYVPRFINRIAILPIVFLRSDAVNASNASTVESNAINEMNAEELAEATTFNVEETTAIPIRNVLNMIENNVQPPPSRSIADESSSAKAPPSTTQQPLIYPLTTTEFMSSSDESNQIARSTARKKPRRFDFVVYGILANNTVIRRYPEDIYDDDANGDHNGDRDIPIVYGILSNSTVLRKYPNGTTAIDEKRSSRKFEITNIDPISLYDPNSAVYREMPSDVEHESNDIVAVNSGSERSDSNPNNQMHVHQSTINSNNLNTTSASNSNNNNANSITAPPSTVFKLPIYLEQKKTHTHKQNTGKWLLLLFCVTFFCCCFCLVLLLLFQCEAF